LNYAPGVAVGGAKCTFTLAPGQSCRSDRLDVMMLRLATS